LDDTSWENKGNGIGFSVRAWSTIQSNLEEVFSSLPPPSGISTAAPFHSDTYLAGGMPAWARTALPSSVLFGRDGKKRQLKLADPQDPGMDKPKDRPYEQYVFVAMNRGKGERMG
jgi:hypothetical protein